MTVITRIGESVAAEGQAQALYELLKSLEPYITGSEGNLGYEVLRHTEDPARFVVIERWESVDAHRKSIEGLSQRGYAGCDEVICKRTRSE